MTSTADHPIKALRSGHQRIEALVRALPPEGLSGPSGASEWTIAQVLSHLGSGAEIGLAGLESSLAGTPKPAGDFNQGVWDRWNAMTPAEQAAGFLTSNENLVNRYEGLDERTRTQATVDLGFLPAPVDIATAASFRLNEFALHAWDVAVAGDPDAIVAADAVEPMMAVVPYLIGWLGKPASVLDGRNLTAAVHTTSPERDFGLALTDKVELTATPAEPDATVTLAAESWIRLATGRLAARHTPSAVAVSGAVTLDQLRRVFPGF